MRRAVSTCLLLMLAASGGCSWIWVKAPPASPQSARAVECSPSSWAPTLDTVVTVLAGLLALGGAAAMVDASRSKSGLSSLGQGAVGAVLAGGGTAAALLYGFSASYGYGATARCRERRAHDNRVHRDRTDARPGERRKVRRRVQPSAAPAARREGHPRP